MLKNKLIYESIIFLIFIILFFVGGLGLSSVWVSWVGVVISSLFLLLYYFKKEKINFPKNFTLLLLFTVLFAISIAWSKKPFESFTYFMMFLAGGFIYLLSYNLNKTIKNYTSMAIKVLFLLGIAFTLFAIIEKTMGVSRVGSFGLIRYSASNFNHHHLGDYWSILILISVYKLFVNTANKYYWILITSFGFLILYLSQSRSAILALLVGLIFLFSKSDKFFKYRKIFFTILGLLCLLILILGGQKGILFQREYFVQAIIGFIKNPIGVGIGNFDLISGKPEYTIFGLNSFSVVAHNLVLEILVGMGVFGLSFILWLFKVMAEVLKNKGGDNLLFVAIFITLTVNFMFDFTYFIPTMLWIWFIVVGVIM